MTIFELVKKIPKRIKWDIWRFQYFICGKDYFGFKEQRKKYKSNENEFFGKLKWLFLLLLFGASAEDYYMYNFKEKSLGEINKFVTLRRRRMVTEYLNEKGHREWVEDKSVFEKRFIDFLHRDFLDSSNITRDDFVEFIKIHERIIAKPKNGFDGKNIYVISRNDNIEEFYPIVCGGGYVIEEYIVQTGFLHELNPGTCNTLRVNVFHSNKETTIFNSVLRMGRGNRGADNFHQGGIMAQVDVNTGVIYTEGTDINGAKYKEHPDSKVIFFNKEIPGWNNVVDTACKAARILNDVPYSSWDIALVGETAAIIEGNTYGNTDVIQAGTQIGKWDYFKYMRDEIKRERKKAKIHTM